jgi:hypothetical protein
VSQLPKRREWDLYPTPPAAVAAALTWYQEQHHAPPLRILDIGAGAGVYGAVARQFWPDAEITGLEIRPLDAPPAYDRWIIGDLTQWEPDHQYGLVLGNPPYKHAAAAVRLGLDCVAPHGLALFLLRLSFLGGQKRAKTLYAEGLLRAVVVCSKRIPFNSDGSTATGPTEHAHFLFGHGSVRPPSLHFLT